MASANRGVVYQQIDRLYRDGTLSGLGDSQLLDRYLTQRDEAAFEALVNLHGPMVLGLCRRMLRDPRDIEDAFQATFLILVRKAPTIRDRGLLANWLFGVAYRVARRARTNILRRRDREMAVANLEAMAPPEATAALGIGPELDQELNRLPRKYRVPLILCYLEGHTHDQAAEELDCPVGTVRSRLARGRDLLRRRLTSRGHAPTAAILGEATTWPAKLMTETVPTSLVTATVEAVVGIGTSKILQAGAVSASVLALTQGVLTTMKLAQLKFVGLALLAAGLTAGGVITVSYASAQAVKDSREASPAPIGRVDPSLASKPQSQEKAPAERTPDDPTAQREKEIERKFDQFVKDIGFFASDGSLGGPASDGSVAGKVFARKLAQMGFTQATQQPAANTTANDPFQLPAKADGQDNKPRAPADPTRRSAREIEVELRLAVAEVEQVSKLRKAAVVSSEEVDRTKGKVSLIKARLEGARDDISDELERLELEIRIMKAEIDRANAQKEVAADLVARNFHHNAGGRALVTEHDVAKAEGELKAANAQVQIKRLEREQIDLRVVQLRRRLDRTDSVIKLADDAQASASAPAGQNPQR